MYGRSLHIYFIIHTYTLVHEHIPLKYIHVSLYDQINIYTFKFGKMWTSFNWLKLTKRPFDRTLNTNYEAMIAVIEDFETRFSIWLQQRRKSYLERSYSKMMIESAYKRLFPILNVWSRQKWMRPLLRPLVEGNRGKQTEVIIKWVMRPSFLLL